MTEGARNNGIVWRTLRLRCVHGVALGSIDACVHGAAEACVAQQKTTDMTNVTDIYRLFAMSANVYALSK